MAAPENHAKENLWRKRRKPGGSMAAAAKSEMAWRQSMAGVINGNDNGVA
jgi:hypothetical protein